MVSSTLVPQFYLEESTTIRQNMTDRFMEFSTGEGGGILHTKGKIDVSANIYR
jgi:hypothetical protein